MCHKIFNILVTFCGIHFVIVRPEGVKYYLPACLVPEDLNETNNPE